jgi:transposase
VLVADNLRSHHTNSVRELADRLNTELMFLPPYTPELNSIEALWSVVKGNLKKSLLEHRGATLKQQHLSDFSRKA